MANTINLLTDAAIAELLSPAADAAGRTGAYVNGKLAAKAFIICHITQGNAATIALTLSQAKDVSGTSPKAISVSVPISANLDCAASDALVVRTAAASYTTDAGVKHKIVVFELDLATVLDRDNGYTCFTVVTGASNAANITQATAHLVGLRYHQAPPPSVAV